MTDKKRILITLKNNLLYKRRHEPAASNAGNDTYALHD